MLGINVVNVIKFFKKNKPKMTREAKTLDSGTKIAYEKLGHGKIRKIITKVNGDVISSTFDKKECRGVTEHTARGSIYHAFDCEPFHRNVIQLFSDRGESITRHGNKGRPNHFFDYNFGRIDSSPGDHSVDFERAMAYIRGVAAQKMLTQGKMLDIIERLN